MQLNKVLAALLVSMFGGLGLVSAQCGSLRYLNPYFSSSRTISNQEFQEAPSLVSPCTFESLTIDLPYNLDVYEPTGDTLSKRPCLVYAHGGGFLIGDKRIIPVPDFCNEMAARGFVVISLDYRKCFNGVSTSSAERAVYRAIQDMRAAIRWVRSEADLLKIDTNMVFAGGNSAGGIMAIQSAFVTDAERLGMSSTTSSPNLGCLDCSGNSLTTGGRPQAVINLWGAIYDTTWADAGEDIPVISVHGDADIAVFPDSGKPFSDPIFPILYGSIPLHDRLTSIGIPNQLILLPGEGHEPWLTNSAYVDSIADWATGFLYSNVLMPSPPLISGPDSICLGDTFRIYASMDNQMRFCWSGTGFSIENAASDSSWIEIEPSSTGTITLSVIGKTIHDVQSSGTTKTIEVLPAFGPFTLTVSGDSLQTTSGYSYQWYLDGTPIPGATANFYVPVTGGSYAVEVRGPGGCSYTTDALTSNAENLDFQQPAINVSCEGSVIRIQDMSQRTEGIRVKLIDLMGREVLTHFTSEKELVFSLESLQDGIFILQFESAEGRMSARIFKQEKELFLLKG